MAVEDDDSLEMYWDALRVGQVRRTPDPGPPDFSDMVSPGDMVFGTSRKRILAIIKPNGTILYGPEYTPEETAVTFWEEMGRRRLGMEERIRVLQHMEDVLVRLGEVDLRCENLRLQAAAEPDPIRAQELTQYAEIAMEELNSAAHAAIELGRGLIVRPEVVQVPAPQSARSGPVESNLDDE